MQNLTDDGDEPEKVKVTQSLPKRSPKQHSTNSCPYNEFKNLRGECVCYEEETNFVGTTFARADDVETYQACQKLCMSQVNCEYWSHYTGNENSNSCLLKKNIMAVSRKSDNDDSVNYVSGTKNCNVPITKGNFAKLTNPCTFFFLPLNSEVTVPLMIFCFQM